VGLILQARNQQAPSVELMRPSFQSFAPTLSPLDHIAFTFPFLTACFTGIVFFSREKEGSLRNKSIQGIGYLAFCYLRNKTGEEEADMTHGGHEHQSHNSQFRQQEQHGREEEGRRENKTWKSIDSQSQCFPCPLVLLFGGDRK